MFTKLCMCTAAPIGPVPPSLHRANLCSCAKEFVLHCQRLLNIFGNKVQPTWTLYISIFAYLKRKGVVQDFIIFVHHVSSTRTSNNPAMSWMCKLTKVLSSLPSRMIKVLAKDNTRRRETRWLMHGSQSMQGDVLTCWRHAI